MGEKPINMQHMCGIFAFVVGLDSTMWVSEGRELKREAVVTLKDQSVRVRILRTFTEDHRAWWQTFAADTSQVERRMGGR